MSLDEPDLAVLARVIDRGSFARAAMELGVTPSALSRRVAALEKRLGVRALERTTRNLRPTELGELLAARGRRVRAELEDAERLVADHRSTPRGLLRICIPTPGSDWMGPVIAELIARYPELRVEVVASDTPLDIIAQGFDVAVHVGTIPASATLGVTRLGRVAPVLAASARYLERAAPLRHPRDLAQHVIVRSGRSRRATWQFAHASGATTKVTVTATPRAFVSSKSLAAQIVAAGIGIALVPRTSLQMFPELRALEPGGYRPTPGPISAVTPSARTAPPKVRAFVDAVRSFITARTDLFG